jgi:hypothetical protein
MIRPSIAEQEADQAGPSPYEITQQASKAEPSAEPNESPSLVLDVLAAPFRGVEDAVRNTYGLADFLTADALPNWDKNFTGESQTGAGKMVEGVSEFLTGFLPMVGPATKVAKLAGLAGKASKLAGAAAAGAVADFTVFDGHEERLSNLVQQFPALRNPITEYLAADASDSKLEGRFKNALEGLGIGMLTDGIFGALSTVKAGRAAKAGTLSAEEAAKVADGAAARVQGALEPLTPKVKLNGGVDDDLARVILEFDPSKVEGSGLFQFPEKGIAHRVDAHADVVKLIENTTAALKKTPPQSMEVLERDAGRLMEDYAGRPAAEFVASLRAREAVMQDAALHDYALGKIMVATAAEVSQKAKVLASGGVLPGMTREQSLLSVMKSQELFASLVSISKGFGTIEGRALNARKFIKNAQVEAVNVARDLVEQFGGAEFISKEMNKLALADSVGTAALMRKQMSFGDRLMRVHNEYWINAVLSGPKTSMVNALGNAFTTLYQPLEQAIGGALAKNPAAVRASLKNYVYLTQHMGDSWNFFVKALKENENFLLADRAVSDTTKGPAISMAGDTLLAHFTNFMGETVRLPGRFLMASDEAFKQLNYRAAAKTELYYRALDKGLAGEALAKYVDEGFSRVVTQGGARFSEDSIVREAIKLAEEKGLSGKDKASFITEYKAKNWDPTNSALKEAFDVANLAQGVAEEATFTRPLGELGKAVQNLSASHPLFQLALPFVRTPTNIIKYASQRGLGFATFMPGVGKLQSRNIAELASKDALVRARAMGRIGAGQMIVSMAAIGALSGRLTGGGPRDPAEKNLLLATGWQPYSVVTTGEDGKKQYISYQRMDPFATFLGLVADWGEQAKRQDPFQSDALQASLTAMVTAISKNVTNKTYLASVAQVVDAINQPERAAVPWARSRIGSYVPGLISQVNASVGDDQTMKEVRGFFDGALNRLPGGQSMLENKRNILGEAIDSPLAQTPLSFANPFVMSKSKDDPVFAELAQFNHGLQAPSPMVNGAINLLEHKTEQGKTAYDRWQQLTGEVSLQGKTLREQLARLIDRPDYQRLPLTSQSDGMDSPRLSEVRRLIGTYRKTALDQLQREVPSVRDAMREYHLGQADLRRGDKARAVERVQAVIAAAQ